MARTLPPGGNEAWQLLTASFLLNMFSRSQCDETWVRHSRGMINVVRTLDHQVLKSTKLGEFLLSSAAYQDISAFTLGKSQPSQRVWLAWKMQAARTLDQHDFTILEAMIGYPETLVTIIALISENAEDNAHLALQSDQGRLETMQPSGKKFPFVVIAC